MHLKSYLDLYQLLESDTSTKEDRRAFGLSKPFLKHKPIAQLMAWLEMYDTTLKRPLLSETFATYLYGMTFILLAIAFIIGFFSGLSLLHYNGKAPVNVVYFMGIVIFLPLFTMCLSLLSMLKVHKSHSVLVHLSPAYWMEKILTLLPKRMQYETSTVKINPLLANWLVIKRSQSMALSFSLGLGLALLLVIITEDIAFAWSTTLHMTPEAFHTFIGLIAVPWEDWVPSAVPSLALIEQSHYFRLGEGLSTKMISHAFHLGQWWKFLLMATLFYAIILRFLIYLVAKVAYSFAIKKSALSLEGVTRLLEEMNEPIISTHAIEKVEKYQINEEGSLAMEQSESQHYEIVQGWAISQKELMLINDTLSLTATILYSVGGTNSFKEDGIIISKSYGKILLYVKAWEPPTMDFMDYLEELVLQVEGIIIAPIGTEQNGYIPVSKAIKVWERKLTFFNNPKIFFKVSQVESV